MAWPLEPVLAALSSEDRSVFGPRTRGRKGSGTSQLAETRMRVIGTWSPSHSPEKSVYGLSVRAGGRLTQPLSQVEGQKGGVTGAKLGSP